MSISRHAATDKKAYWFMLIVETVVFTMLYIFVVYWLTPAFNLPSFVNILITTSCLGFVLAAIIPDVSGWKSTFHSLSAYTASTILIPILTIMYISKNVSDFAKFVIILALIFQLGSVSVFMVIKNAKKYHLYIQAIYFLMFDLSLLAVAYIR